MWRKKLLYQARNPMAVGSTGVAHGRGAGLKEMLLGGGGWRFCKNRGRNMAPSLSWGKIGGTKKGAKIRPHFFGPRPSSSPEKWRREHTILIPHYGLHSNHACESKQSRSASEASDSDTKTCAPLEPCQRKKPLWYDDMDFTQAAPVSIATLIYKNGFHSTHACLRKQRFRHHNVDFTRATPAKPTIFDAKMDFSRAIPPRPALLKTRHVLHSSHACENRNSDTMAWISLEQRLRTHRF